MAFNRHVVHLNDGDDDEVRRPIDSSAANPIRLDLRDDADIVATGKPSLSSSRVE